MGSKYTIYAWVLDYRFKSPFTDEEEIGYYDAMIWQGQSLLAALWILWRTRKSGITQCVTLKWR